MYGLECAEEPDTELLFPFYQCSPVLFMMTATLICWQGHYGVISLEFLDSKALLEGYYAYWVWKAWPVAGLLLLPI